MPARSASSSGTTPEMPWYRRGDDSSQIIEWGDTVIGVQGLRDREGHLGVRARSCLPGCPRSAASRSTRHGGRCTRRSSGTRVLPVQTTARWLSG
jgi:hypothetical protein